MKKIIVICKRSIYNQYVKGTDVENNTNTFIKELRDIKDIQNNHFKEFKKILEEFKKNKKIIYSILQRNKNCGSKEIGKPDLIISFGGDGNFLYTIQKNTKNIPVMGVNPNPKTSVGHYCNYTVDTFEQGLLEFLKGKNIIKKFNRLVFNLNGEELRYKALNDCLIASSNPAEITRYLLITDTLKKDIRSSGLLVSTSTGSTAWMYNEGGIAFENNSLLEYINRGVRNQKGELVKDLEIHIRMNKCTMFVDGSKFKIDLKICDCLKISLGGKVSII